MEPFGIYEVILDKLKEEAKPIPANYFDTEVKAEEIAAKERKEIYENIKYLEGKKTPNGVLVIRPSKTCLNMYTTDKNYLRKLIIAIYHQKCSIISFTTRKVLYEGGNTIQAYGEYICHKTNTYSIEMQPFTYEALVEIMYSFLN